MENGLLRAFAFRRAHRLQVAGELLFLHEQQHVLHFLDASVLSLLDVPLPI
jgi:hypothetical protein